MTAARHFIDESLLVVRKKIDEDLQLWRSRKKHQGLEFEGSIVAAFWDSSLNGYAADIINAAFESARIVADQNNFDPVSTMREAGGATENEIHFMVNKMIRIDRGMRGKGFPDSVSERDASFELKRCLKRAAARTAAEVDAAKARSSDSVTLPLSPDQGLLWYFRNCSHGGRLKVGSLLLVVLSAGFFAGRTDFIRRFVDLFAEPPKMESKIQPKSGDTAKAKTNVTTK